MSLILHRSSDPDRLALEVCRVLAEPPDDPMATDRIAVHSRGVEQWLAMQVASTNGIFGAATFHRPEDLVARLAADALNENLVTTWTAGELLWALLAELPDHLHLPVFAPVEAYLKADGPSEHTLRLVTLCQRLASVFQAYGSYRPELVRSWQTPADDEPWEAPLWRAVESRIGATHLTAWADRLAGRTLPTTAARTLLFTVTTLPPLALRIVAELAGSQPVHLFALHPSPAAWKRSRSEHPLLWSMGTLAQDFRSVATSCPVEHRLIEAEPPPRDSLLHAIQADLHDDTLRSFTMPPVDPSLQLHVCSSPLRQVQVLRDTLLRLLDDPTLEPRDIVVMTPDVEAFAPLIQAVFRDGSTTWREHASHPAGFPALPFRLADRGVRAENQVADALMTLLDLAESRLEAPEVVAFLSLDPVRETFGLAVDALPRVRELLVEAGARWGADAAHRQAERLPPDDRFTWRFALDRLLLGQALSTPETDLVLGHAPGCDLESLDDRHLLGGLVDFLETLLSHVAALQTPREPGAWFRQLSHALEALVSTESGRSWQSVQVAAGLDELRQQAEASAFDAQVDLRTIRTLVSGRFSAREPGQGFLAGSITVCQLVPLRSIPFEVVCLLGMDEGVFPRIQSRPGYDRMSLSPQPGDRNARIDDRALFLEALQSARQTLVITCTGRSEQSGRALPLAVPVAELLDTVRSMAGGAAVDHLTTSHALQPWSPHNFRGERSSFDRRMLDAARAWQTGRREPRSSPLPFAAPLPPPSETPTELMLQAFVRFWMHPPSDLVRRRLGLSLWEDDIELSAELPFALDGLQTWHVKRELLREGLHTPPHSFAERAARGALLPMGTPGQLVLDDQQQAIDSFLASVRPLLLHPAPPVDVHLPGEPALTGRIGDLYAAGRVVLQPGTVHPRHLLQLWIEHLALHGMGWSGTSTLLGPAGGRRLVPLSNDDAAGCLDTLRRGFQLGQREPLLFWADASYAAHGADEGSMAAFYATQKEWGYRKDAVRDVDTWVLGPHTNPFFPSFDPKPLAAPTSVARRVWAPVMDRVEEVTV